MAWRFSQLLGTRGVAGMVRAHGGLEYLGVVGGELVGSFPGEVRDLAPSGQVPQRCVVYVGAEGLGRGRPDRSTSGGFVGVANGRAREPGCRGPR